MPAEHETMTAEQIEALKIWTPFWSEADCRKALGVIEAQAASLARLQAAQAVAREALLSIRNKCPATCDMTRAHEMADDADNALATIDAALKGAHPAQGTDDSPALDTGSGR